MLQKFFKYIFQSMAGMLGISVYILADTYFISVYSGADGLAVLNLILPVYGLIYAIGAMIGIGSATRYAIDRARGKSTSFYFLSAVTWDILISIPLVLAGIFIPDKILQLLGADAGLTALGKQYLRIILAASPFFMSNYAFTAFARNDSAPAIAMLGSIAGSMFNIVFDYVFMFPAGLGLTGASDDDHLQHALPGKTQSGRISFPRSIPAPPDRLLPARRIRLCRRNILRRDRDRL